MVRAVPRMTSVRCQRGIRAATGFPHDSRPQNTFLAYAMTEKHEQPGSEDKYKRARKCDEDARRRGGFRSERESPMRGQVIRDNCKHPLWSTPTIEGMP